MDGLIEFLGKQDERLRKDAIYVAKAVYKAIHAKKPKLSYAAPMHAKLILFFPNTYYQKV